MSYQKKHRQILLRVKKMLISGLIVFIKLITILFSLLVKVLFIFKRPVITLARFLFYKVVVKSYCYYGSFIRKIGVNKRKQNVIVFLLNEKTVHILIVVMTICVIFANITHDSHASDEFFTDKKSVMQSLVRSEFGDIDQEELIVETADSNSVLVRQKIKNSVNDLVAVGAEYNDLYKDKLLRRKDISDKKIVNNSNSDSENKIIKDRKEIVKYIVKPGDTVSVIAEKFGVSVNTVLWENNLSVYDFIGIGDELAILPSTGVMHTVKSGESLGYISSKYDVKEKDIIKENKIVNPHSLKIGQRLFIPNGTKIKTARKTNTYNSAITTVVKNIVAPKTQSTGKMHWPTTSHRITQYYHWRHHGLDLAAPIGTPLFAADSGVVERAGWNRGYGNNIVINHGGGKKTRYAHMHKFYVSAGQSVSRGQTIGEMGSTGWSTGPHVHFEVMINGVKYNPLNYIK